MSEAESGGLEGLRVWAEEASRRAAGLISQEGTALREASAYDGAIEELDRLVPLLEHDPGLRNRLTIVLGALLAWRFAAGGRAGDKERAQRLLREGVTPKPGVTIAPQEQQIATALLAMTSLPVPDFGPLFRGEDRARPTSPAGTWSTRAEWTPGSGRSTICQFMAISYAASGGHFLRTVARDRRDPASAAVLLADPRCELTLAEYETAALHAAFYPDARMLGEYYESAVEPDALGTPDEVMELLGEPLSVLHLACHGSAASSPPRPANRHVHRRRHRHGGRPGVPGTHGPAWAVT